MIKSFNDGWVFSAGVKEREVCLPHDAMIEEERSATCQSGKQCAYFRGGKYTYTKKFDIAAADIGKDIRLSFEGVYRNAEVFINGKKVGAHRYGYTPFYVDISAAVRAGENDIVVTADNFLVPNCRWYTGSGIYRPVWISTSPVGERFDIKIKTLSYSPAEVEVVSDKSAVISICCGGNLVYRGAPGKIKIDNAKLWSAEEPNLYTCTAECGGEKLSYTFGIRKVEWSAQRGLTVNGKIVKLRGGCIHHDNGVLGACSFPDAEERRVRILKEQGFNALRISHNPASRALLDACDRLGMYVLDECFDGWYIPKDYHDYSRDFMQGYKSDLAAMVQNDYNHPSVIMYSVGNEVTETVEERGIKLCAEMRDILHSLDDTRPVTCGINVLLDAYVKKGLGIYKDKGAYRREPLPENSRYREKKAGSAFFNYWAQKLGKLMFFMSKGKTAERVVRDISPSLDIVGLNYASSRYDIDAKKYPDRLMLGTETMAGDLPYNWARVQKYPQLLGDFVWSAWDYIGEACIGDWTYYSYKGLPLLAGQGMVDITGQPKAQMAFIQVVWGIRKQPYLCVRPLNHSGERPKKSAWQFTDALPSWTWYGYEGKPTTVEVYAKEYAVRLELNGKKIGQKKVKNFKALFKVKYTAGELAATALDKDGNEVGRTVLKTGGSDAIIEVKTDRRTLRPNGQDLCFAEIEFTDGRGNLLPYIERPVKVELSGSGAYLAGFGSALCKTDEGFLSNVHSAYRGRALAVFRAQNKCGKTCVKISSEGVAPVQFEIEVK